ncbi:CHASE2 domain-containing protein [Noviherbaspirillum galbum]|uniref:Adenylate/guanylate cyclase domain-containing protein n=1 Tax=Noviherbaspirillum galbum TaxID=2709383 RepID=A0A6B3SP35_9BURK|nr:adenylate/guanylate cyclase domain-containing protein [Noviherbaspirillum galbum]NEX60466.1 adenylate/guanylate cyclase domain-containing protein [Noviherbaspirillum galbum]
MKLTRLILPGRLSRKYGAQWAVAAGLTLLACLYIKEEIGSRIVDRLEVFAYDSRIRAQHGELDPRVVIVDIDEKSIGEVGRWPWSRDVLADLVGKLDDKYHVSSVGFDVTFPEPDNSAGFATLQTIAQREFGDIPRFAQRLDKIRPQFDFDARFAQALAERPAVLGYFFSNEERDVNKGMLPRPAFTTAALGGQDLDAQEYRKYTGNLPLLQQSARAGGFINPWPDDDGIIRRLPLLVRHGDGYYESLAFSTVRMALGASRVKPVFYTAEELHLDAASARAYGALKGLELNTKPRPMMIPLDRDLSMLVNYRGTGGPAGGQYRYVSAVDVLKERLPVDVLADNIVLVGTTSAGLKDLRVSPTNVDYPGVEMHANIISSILDGVYKQQPDFHYAVQLAYAVGLGLALGLLLPALAPLASIAVSLAAGGAVIASNLYMFETLDYVIPVAPALLLVAALFLFNLAWGYLFEFRKSRAMVSLFGEYVAPELVAEMAESPASYSMEGETRELTVLFCDVRGFTTISEGLDANALREYINLYLTAMSEDIRGNRGTLDKYIGDAVMAFWGAPVRLPDHASRAVATALKMLESAARLDADFRARGWPALNIGIGLNTGEMRVGDMGSRIRRAYTVMGDAVNLGSRLEGITKEYGVGLLVGEATRLAAPGFVYRELDRVRVKGKNEPVPIYEPVGRSGDVNETMQAEIGRWHEALAMVRAQQWDAAEGLLQELLRQAPERRLYQLYLGRVRRYREQPPGEGWDGVTTFDTK